MFLLYLAINKHFYFWHWFCNSLDAAKGGGTKQIKI
jgi:hypothetical protein